MPKKPPAPIIGDWGQGKVWLPPFLVLTPAIPKHTTMVLNDYLDVTPADFDETAKYLKLEYSADTLWKLYQYQYRTFRPTCPYGAKETDYVVEQMNDLLETMRAHYGPAGGGRYTLPEVRRQELRRLELVK